MGKYFVDIKDDAKIHLRKIYKSGDQATIKRLEKIIVEISLHPKSGIGNPELLKYNLSRFWSGRINKKDRLIYEIIEEPKQMVVVISALGHY